MGFRSQFKRGRGMKSAHEPLNYMAVLRRRMLWIIVPVIFLGFLNLLYLNRAPEGLTGSAGSQGLKMEKPTSESQLSPPSSSQANPGVLRFLGFVVGLAIGVGLALIREFRDRASNREGDIARRTQLPVLVSVPVIVIEHHEPRH